MDASHVKLILKAAKNGNSDAVRLLLAHDPSLIAARDKDGSTPLHCAAWNGHEEVAEILLQAGADVNDHNQNDHWGTTPLHAAAHSDRKEVAALLIARGADIHAKNLYGRTPLGETTIHNAKFVAKLLTAHGLTD